MFRFLVGPDEQEFTIHSALVACQSPALRAMIDGQFKEATAGCAILPDFDPKTFTSFWQYVYTGNYADPEPSFTPAPGPHADSRETERPAESMVDASANTPLTPEAAQPSVPVADEWDWGISKKKKTKPCRRAHVWEPEPPSVEEWRKCTKQMALWEDFKESWGAKLITHPQPMALGDNMRPQSHRDVPLHHARVYVLSEYYGVTELESVSFGKLHNALVDYSISKSGEEGIIALLRYCFVDLSPDRLKQLVAHYVACKLEHLWKSIAFQELLEEHGCISRAVIQSLLPRLH